MPSSQITKLLELANKKNLEEFAIQLCTSYPELNNLTDAVITPESYESHFQGRILGKHVEFDKSVVAILSLCWTFTGNYTKLVECQQGPSKLKESTFRKLQKWVVSQIQNEKELEFALICILMNDLGKVPDYKEYAKQHGYDCIDHDQILYHAFKTAKLYPQDMTRLFPSTKHLNSKQIDLIEETLKVDFKFAQFIQAENVPECLDSFARSTEFKKTILLHAIFDLIGAAGHVKQNGSLVLTEDTCNDILQAQEILLQKNISSRQMYHRYLQCRNKSFGFDENWITLTRIACMCRFHTKEDVVPLLDAWNCLHFSKRIKLDEEFGLELTPSLLLYYSPAMFVNAMKRKEIEKQDNLFQTFQTIYEICLFVRDQLSMKKDMNDFYYIQVDVGSVAKKISENIFPTNFELKVSTSKTNEGILLCL